MKMTVTIEVGDNEKPLELSLRVESVLQNYFSKMAVQMAGRPDSYESKRREVRVTAFEE